ncbi:MAG: DUF4906 domain-containing protein [Bacteroidales bacterium]|nr:DUF4906 domain-containing protein [Bacteroidales bacterium]
MKRIFNCPLLIFLLLVSSCTLANEDSELVSGDRIAVTAFITASSPGAPSTSAGTIRPAGFASSPGIDRNVPDIYRLAGNGNSHNALVPGKRTAEAAGQEPATKSSIAAVSDRVTDLNLWVYSGGRLYDESYSDYTGGSRMELMSGSRFNIYAVCNTGHRLEPPVNESELETYKLELTYSPDRATVPMAGSLKGVVPTVGGSLELRVDRLLSRIGFRLDKSALEHADLVIRSVKISQAPAYAYPFSSSFQAAPDEVVEGDCASEADIAALQAGEEVYFYCGENCHGDLLPGNEDPWQKVPDNLSPTHSGACSYLDIDASYSSDEARCDEMKIRLYLGENTTSNFDVFRNTWYHLTLIPSDESINRDSWKVECGEIDRLYPFMYYVSDDCVCDSFGSYDAWLFKRPQRVSLITGTSCYVYFKADEFITGGISLTEELISMADFEIEDNFNGCASVSFHDYDMDEGFICFKLDAISPARDCYFAPLLDGDNIMEGTGKEYVWLDFDILGQGGTTLEPWYEIRNATTGQIVDNENGEPVYIGQKLKVCIKDGEGNSPSEGSVYHQDPYNLVFNGENYCDDFYEATISTTSATFDGLLRFDVAGASLDIPLKVLAPDLYATVTIDVTGRQTAFMPQYTIDGDTYDSWDEGLYNELLAEIQPVSDRFVSIVHDSLDNRARMSRLEYEGVEMRNLCTPLTAGLLFYKDMQIRASGSPCVRGVCAVFVKDPFPGSNSARRVSLGDPVDGYEYERTDGQTYNFEMMLNQAYEGLYECDYIDGRTSSTISSTYSGITIRCIAAEEDEEEFGIGQTSLGMYVENDSGDRWYSRTDWYFTRICHYGIALQYSPEPDTNDYLIVPQWYHISVQGLSGLYMAHEDLSLRCVRGGDLDRIVHLGDTFDTGIFQPEGYDNVQSMKRDFSESAWSAVDFSFGLQREFIMYDFLGFVD